MASLIRSDLEFILKQIVLSEAHAAGADPVSLVPNTFAPFGLRTVDGSYNNLLPGQSEFGAADNPFPRLVDAVYRDDADSDSFGPVSNTDYGAPGSVADADPRIISNLIVDQTISNPAAVQAYVAAGLGTLDVNGVLRDLDGVAIPAGQTLVMPNVSPDEGLSAPFNSWFTFFGQFFDHGLDLVNKGGNEHIYIPLQPDDPLYNPLSPQTNFMVLTRATPSSGDHINQTTPFVDQNQTYTSHASHQVFLREYQLDASGRPVATGALLDGTDGGLANWAQVKAQARDMLGIDLTDLDVFNVPLLRTDAYGKFIPDPATGFAQVITGAGLDGVLNTGDDIVAVGGPGAAAISPLVVGALRTGHAFLDDIAHNAVPGTMFDPDGPAPDSAPDEFVQADTGEDDAAGNAIATDYRGRKVAYDNELLDRHFITGDGRGNENIALTAVHHVFHSEHNRQVDEIKATVTATGDAAFMASWKLPDGSWNGERLFQAARFATEMQYQHLVFEEFARKVQPAIDEFLAETNYQTAINPAIVAEFAHAVYRVGHSMLTDTVDRLDPNFNVVGDPNSADPDQELGLIQAFLNPILFNNDGALSPEVAAGAIVRGMTRQEGNQIDEFVAESLRNSLLGLPLDLAAINIARGRDTGVPTLNAARREFFATTADPLLKPYTSWVDLTQNLKNPASAINFIAAYGVHEALQADDVDTLAEKRAVAAALAFGGDAVINAGIVGEERTFTADEDDRIAFLNSLGDYQMVNGITTTGVDAIDLWIGGLAEKTMPFGGMLGSTFNFVFENQMEALQNGDRFYYLARLAGLNFLTEMENNTFAKLVMANTDTTHLPSDIFSTPGFILEVDRTQQFTGLGADGRADPTDGGTTLVPLVIRDNPATPGPDTNYLKYTGGDHVVLGGTAGNDIIISSIGDDSIYGDGGNDRIEGGDGNDHVDGGADDDIITDRGGDDVLKGNDGNDVIHGGNGANLIIAGSGKDFVITGEDVSEVFAGQGDDFVLGSKGNLPTFGNEGNDWIELGTQDGTTGDSFDPLGLDSIIGHDVLISGGGFDELIGEGGDDIFTGSDGEDHFDGGSGFDWATYKFDKYGVTADMIVSDLIEPPVAPSSAGIMDRFAFTEGLSGSAFADVLRGDDADATLILQAGTTGSVLTNLTLIDGLQGILPEGITRFGAGNIILGGDGSDVIEGRGGNDIIDGDAWLNVRIAVSGHPTITSVDSMKELVPRMLSGEINPSQLEIVREVLMSDSTDFDTAMFSGRRADYTIITNLDGSVTVNHDLVSNVANDGTDTLRNMERLQFADQAVVLMPGVNNAPTGLLTLSDTTPAVNQTLTVSAALINDLDNPGGSITGGPISYVWQYEPNAALAPGVFRDIVDIGGGLPATASGNSFTVSPLYQGMALRVRAVYQDADGVLENVYSAPTALVAAGAAPAPAPLPVEDVVDSTGVRYIRSDLQFILDQILISERHADGEDLLSLLPNSRVPFGMRTVDGSLNNLVQDQADFGAADTLFPRLLDADFRNDGDGDLIDINGPDPGGIVSNTNYASTTHVADADPRIISNLIVDQTDNNPATAGLGESVESPGPDGIFGTGDEKQVNLIPNTAPDEGLSAPFNSLMTFFGQFFDHGLDLVTKGGNGTVFIPLEPDDPLYNPASPGTNFLVLTRSTQFDGPGPDGVMGSADDTEHEAQNTTTPFIDQNQTYTSHPSHQVFVREYELNDLDRPVSTGRLITNRDIGPDLEFGTADDIELGGMATWAVVRAQARDLLGIDLTDVDALNLPLLRTDAYGKFIPATNGLAQVITGAGPDGLLNTADDLVAVGTLAVPINTFAVGAVRTGHAFLDDIAHRANPVNSQTGMPTRVADADAVISTGPLAPNTYDDELLDAHYIAGDGRANENIALTAVHHVFHAEHNRLVDHTKAVVLASNDVAFLNQWLSSPVAALPANQAQIDALLWNGERLFQAARFGTEMQYQHLVFEEFARKVQPQVDIFFAATQVYDTEINPAIVAEFAHTVYRFGHSMLTETVDRFDADFNVVGDSNPTAAGNQQLGLIAAFLNPLEFAASGPGADEAAGALMRGLTRQTGNAIDEFVTEALRNNLLGLPLDLAAINLARGRDTGVPSLNAARRDFHEVTGDSQLKPYTSWVDFMQHIKHEASVINFIAAYGTHTSITTADGLAAKRAAATKLVLGDNTLVDPVDIANFNADRMAFLHSTVMTAGQAVYDYSNGPDGVTITGVDDIDLWIGGLAEKNMPFGGMLGSTFNFVFEEQMEKLQDGDRFYYLERTQGLNFLTELENNTFARLVMANTDVKHLPGDIFSAPGYTLEVDQTLQFTGLGASGRDDPNAPDDLVVLRDNPGTAGPDPRYLAYSGEDHVVLGGTGDDDTIIASIGDDTLYGDAGHDRLEGGFGNDMIFGGTGHDIMTDMGGDDNMQGGDGNDAIHGGNGLNLILGGFGSDFIVTGEDPSEAFGGPGNDFILGARGNEFVFGNEGDDWIEHGMADGSAGENFDAFSRDLSVGHDVFIGNTISDRMDGEGGDDIMVGNGGQVDRYEGGSGFDWASFHGDAFGVTADLLLRAFDETPVPLSNITVLARFTSIEGMSGSHEADVLQGDHNDAAAMALSGATGSVLNNIGLIDGLQDMLDGMLGGSVTSFAGNIILGGGGSDLLEGRGGDDLIDGDAWLNVQLEAPDGNGGTVRASSMTELQERVFAGDLNPGNISIVRELGTPQPDYDTAVFSDVISNYIVDFDTRPGFVIVSHRIVDPVDGEVTAGPDGVDVLRNVERFQFSDIALDFDPGVNQGPDGLLTISDTTPTEDSPLTVSSLGVTDPDNFSTSGAIPANTIAYFWQVEVSPGVFEDIILENVGGEAARATGPTYTPRGFEVGLALRVRAVYKDENEVLENVYSEATAPVISNNTAPGGQVRISDITPTETQPLQAINEITDADGRPEVFNYQWQQSALGGGAAFANIVGATGDTFTPGQAQVNRQLRVVTTYTDLEGHPETVISAPTIVTGDFVAATPLTLTPQTLTGTNGQDIISGGGGVDTINGLGEDDWLDGGGGNDTIAGGAGNDTMLGGAGADTITDTAGDDLITGGAGNDNINGGAGNDRFVATEGDGSDSYIGGTGVDTYDLFDTTAGATVTATTATSGQTGSDTHSVENIIGSKGDDTITMNGGANVIDGRSGNDVVNGGGGADTLIGGEGNDTLAGGTGADLVNGDAGDDTVNYLIGDGADAVDGGEGNDQLVITGTGAAQTLAILLSGTVITTFAGSTLANVEAVSANLLGGADTLSYGTTTDDVVVNLATASATGFTSIANIENVTGGSGIDTLTGNGGANVLNGGAGNDTFTGGAGTDTANGGAGNDRFLATLVVGGDGNDTYAGGGGTDDVYDLSGTTVAATVTSATATSTQIGTDTLAGIEHFIGSSAGDTLTGNGVANTIEGGGGGDVINGAGGADQLLGGIGNDTINGGAGTDVINGGDGNDTTDGGAGADRFVAASNDGNDSYIGNTGLDTYDLSGTTANATVTATTATSGETGSDTHSVENIIGSQGDDGITMNGGANVVDGQDGNDTISTGAGADRLIGGAGNDSMNGGTGNDIFVFAPGFGNDTITGFDASPDGANAQDRLDISALGIDTGNFGGRVVISDLGANTLVEIDGLDSILLLGVSGVAANSITQADFLLA